MPDAPEVRALEIADADAGARLDVVLARRLSGLSRSVVASLIRDGHVSSGGRPVKPSQLVHAGQVVTVSIPPPEPSELVAEEIPLRILYEDDQVLAIDKPAGLVVHPAHGHRSGTLVNAILGRALAVAPDEPHRPGIVHRLDKDTSGCIVVAKTTAARVSLEAQFKGRTVGKTYLAVVHGVPSADRTIDAPIGRDPRHRKRFRTNAPRSRAAETRFRVVERLSSAALLEVSIRTGRTHQIRVHLASVGHPVVGDDLYAGRRGRRIRFSRQALHAAELRVRHPESGELLVIRAPLPIDMRELLDRLRAPGEPGERVLR